MRLRAHLDSHRTTSTCKSFSVFNRFYCLNRAHLGSCDAPKLGLILVFQSWRGARVSGPVGAIPGVTFTDTLGPANRGLAYLCLPPHRQPTGKTDTGLASGIRT
jgi:hypothetical protein